MIKTILGIAGAAAIVVLAASHGKVFAEAAPKPPACKTLADESTAWKAVPAVIPRIIRTSIRTGVAFGGRVNPKLSHTNRFV